MGDRSVRGDRTFREEGAADFLSTFFTGVSTDVVFFASSFLSFFSCFIEGDSTYANLKSPPGLPRFPCPVETAVSSV